MKSIIKRLSKTKTIYVLVFLIFLILLDIIFVMFNCSILHVNSKLIGVEDKAQILKMLGITLGGLLLMIQANVSNRRALSSEKSLKQERLKNAIEHLGSEKSVIRIGGLCELYHLAKEVDELKATINDIICAFVKDYSSSSNYLPEEGKSVTEIQTAIDLLFVDDTFTSNRKYLTDSNLVGVNFHGKTMNDVRFHRTVFGNNSFAFTQQNEVWYLNNNLEGIYFSFSKLHNCSFRNCKGIDKHTFGWDVKLYDTTFENTIESIEEISEGTFLQNVSVKNDKPLP